MIELAEAPSAELWRALVELDPAAMSAEDLAAGIVAWERLKSCAEAMQNELLVAWEQVELPEIDWFFHGKRTRWRVEQLALQWGVSAFAAGNRVSQAVVLVETLPQLHAALKCGRVTGQHARMTANAARHLPPKVARDADAAVMADDGWRTPSQLERAFTAQVLRLDPQGSAERHLAARKDRQVSVRDQPDGMASAFALLPADDAQAFIKTLDACALSSKATNLPGDDRTLAQRRADALVELVTGSSSWSATFRPAGRGTAGTADTAGAGAAAAGAAETDDAPTDSCTCGGTATTASNTATTGNRDARTKGRRPDVQVTVSMSTLIGRDDAPAMLTGYGWIDATTARRICADPTATWRRLLTDPVSGALLDYGRTTYRPPADLRDFVVARDVSCRFPNCDRPAMVCELDHRAEYDHTDRTGDGTGGTTCPDNIDSLCQNHHRLKHESGWTHRRDADTGDSIWTDPHGRDYEKTITVLPKTAPVEPPATVVPDDCELGDPPF